MNSRAHPPVVAVTGASGYIGSRLLQELEEEEGLAKVLAIDTKPLAVPFHNVVSERMDITEPLDDAFREHNVNAVVHLAFTIKPGRTRNDVEKIRRANLGGMHSVLKACCAAKVRNLIYLSSHTIYGARKGNPVPITEEAALHPSPDFQYAYDKALCEETVQDFAAEHPEVNVTVLRSCVVMGPGADNFVTKSFFKPVLLGVMGYNPPLQFLHEDDLARLLHMLIMEPHPGTYNVAGEGVVHYKRMAQLSRRKLLSLPSAMTYPLTQIAWNLGIQKDSPAAGLDFIRYPILISTSKLKEATDFRFLYTSEEALTSYLPDDAPTPMIVSEMTTKSP